MGFDKPVTDTNSEGDRKLWFDFLSKLNDRSLQQKRESGATTWVLLAAAAAIVYKCVPLIPQFLSVPATLKAASLIFILEVDILMFFGVVVNIALPWPENPMLGRLLSRAAARFKHGIGPVFYIAGFVMAVAHALIARDYIGSRFIKWTLAGLTLIWFTNAVIPAIVEWRKNPRQNA